MLPVQLWCVKMTKNSKKEILKNLMGSGARVGCLAIYERIIETLNSGPHIRRPLPGLSPELVTIS